MSQFQFAGQGRLDKLTEVITRENVNDVNRAEQTALYIALVNEHLDCAQFLVDMGADVNLHSGVIPLAVVFSYSSLRSVPFLLENGASAWDALISISSLNRWWGIPSISPEDKQNLSVLLDYLPETVDDLVSRIEKRYASFIGHLLNLHHARTRCAGAAITLYGLRRFRGVARQNDMNVFRLIGKHIWSTRRSDAWEYAKKKEKRPNTGGFG